MAMTDYFYGCYKIEKQTVADGLGGYETVEYLGISFQGLAVKKGSNEQLVGSLRGSEQTQYTFHTLSSVPLEKDDKVMYYEEGVAKYIRLTASAEINAKQSRQTNWKTYPAESYIPVSEIK